MYTSVHFRYLDCDSSYDYERDAEGKVPTFQMVFVMLSRSLRSKVKANRNADDGVQINGDAYISERM